ncbi:MAG: AbrB/MazE/SpoVT family DNA-binding domain-containing protein [Firmicutes bacterium]|nr:AbrB/MazE/SpoVT family DNA-binding domain-containing protein [Bacillota bacterium]
MSEKTGDKDKFMSTVKIGPKGQIVIPKEVREMFGLYPGDTLLLLADSKRGIALERAETMRALADAIFSGKDQGEIEFAEKIKKITGDKNE